MEQYNEWEKVVAPYEDYVSKEKDRINQILPKKKNEILIEISAYIPNSVKTAMTEKTKDISIKFNLEYFSKEEMETILSPEVSIYEKINIYNSQTPSINPTDSQIFGDRKIS